MKTLTLSRPMPLWRRQCGAWFGNGALEARQTRYHQELINAPIKLTCGDVLVGVVYRKRG